MRWLRLPRPPLSTADLSELTLSASLDFCRDGVDCGVTKPPLVEKSDLPRCLALGVAAPLCPAGVSSPLSTPEVGVPS